MSGLVVDTPIGLDRAMCKDMIEEGSPCVLWVQPAVQPRDAPRGFEDGISATRGGNLPRYLDGGGGRRDRTNCLFPDRFPGSCHPADKRGWAWLRVTAMHCQRRMAHTAVLHGGKSSPEPGGRGELELTFLRSVKLRLQFDGRLCTVAFVKVPSEDQT
ncbi:hypothetical protein MRX96_023198 [Rhipicephalus microplus]